MTFNYLIIIMRNITLDLPRRIERRFIIPSSAQFLDRVSPYVERKRFSDNRVVQTIYFNTDEHIVPFEMSLKARRYLPGFPAHPSLEDDTYFLDLKTTENEYKQKVRLETTLEEATEIVNGKFPFSEIPLRPYVLVHYSREHYVPNSSSKIRLTLDKDLRFFFFPPNQREAVEIGGEEDYVRIEIKEEEPDDVFDKVMREILTEISAFPTISKKFSAYNSLGLHRARTSGRPFHKELKDCEIESKLEADSEEVFHRVKQFFSDGHSDFKLSHFPYTFESASINRYYRNNSGLFKALFRGKNAHIVTKGKVEVMRNKFGLDCILKREELKGKDMPLSPDVVASAQLLGELHRMRKAFWIENPRTTRFYHVSLDCCHGSPGTLYEMEIEYTGRYTDFGKTREEEIIEDIAEITKTLVDKFPELRPSQLTKQGWLGVE